MRQPKNAKPISAAPVAEEKKNQETDVVVSQPIQDKGIITGQVTPTTNDNKPTFDADWDNFTSQIISELPKVKESKIDIWNPKQSAAARAYENAPEDAKIKAKEDASKSTQYSEYELEQQQKEIEPELPKEKKATDIATTINEDDVKAATGQANPYPLATVKAADYEDKVANYKQSQERINNWIIQTANTTTGEKYTVTDYFDWQKTYQDEMEATSPYVMADYKNAMESFIAKGLSGQELDDAMNNYWDMFTADKFSDIENKAWAKFSESRGVSMKDATVPQKLDYLLSSVTSNTIIGAFSAYSKSLLDASIDAIKGGTGDVQKFYMENMDYVKANRSKYKDLSTTQEVAETAILLAADLPTFTMMGAGAGALTNYGWRAGANILKYMGVPQNIAKIAAIQSMSNIAKSSVTTGALLGTYDLTLSLANKLSTTRISDLDSEDYKEMANSFGKGMAAGVAIGVFSGITHNVLQRMNSNAVKKLYSTVDGGISVKAGGSPSKIKLINIGVHTAAGIIEGGVIFPLSHAIYDYAQGNEDAFSEITAESMIKDGIKFAIAIKAQQMPSIIEQVQSSAYIIDPNFKKPFENDFTYSKAELNRLGVKDYFELKSKAKDQNWIEGLKDNKNITSADFLKVMYDAEGLMFNKSMSVDKSTAEKVNGKPVLVSRDAKGGIVDIVEYKSMKEAKQAEYAMEEINITDGVVVKASNLDARGIMELNAEYEKSPEKLILLNEAFAKVPSQRTAGETQAILELNNKITKRVDAVKKESTKLESEVKPEEKPVEAENKTTETVLTLNDTEYTIREENGKKEVLRKNEQGLLTRENDNAVIEQVIKEYDTKNKSGLPSEVREGQEPIEAKPVEETGNKEVETGGDVQASEKEVSDKTQLMAKTKEKVPELKGEKLLFNKKEVDAIKEKTGLNVVKQTAKDMKDFGKKIVNILKDAKNNGSLSDIKYRSLIKKMSETIKETKKRDGTIITPEEKREAVLNYVAEGLVDANNRKFKSDTIQQQKKGRKIGNKKVNPFGKYSPKVNDALRLDISNLDQQQMTEYRNALDKFVAAGGGVGQNEATIKEFLDAVSNIEVSPKEKKAIEQQDVDDLIKEVFESKITNIKEYAAAKSKLRRIASFAQKIYDNKIAEIPSDATPNERAKLEEKALKEYQETIDYIVSDKGEIDLTSIVEGEKDAIKQEYQDKIDENIATFSEKTNKKEFKDTYLPDQNDVHKEFVERISSDLVKDNMTLKDAELFDYALDNINNGFTNGFTNEAIQRANELYTTQKVASALLDITGTGVYKRIKMDAAKLKSILNTTDWYRIDQYFKKTNNKIYEALFLDLNKGAAKKEKFVTTMLKDHAKIVDKFMKYQKLKGLAKGQLPHKAAQDADIKTAIILNERMWQSNAKTGEDGKVYELVDALPSNMTSYWGNIESRDIKPGDVSNGDNFMRTLEVWNKLKQDKNNFNSDGSLNIDYIISKLSPIEKKYLESTIKVNEALKPYNEWATEINGRPPKSIEKYDMQHIVTDTKKINKKVDESTIDGMIAAAAKPTKQASSTHERTMKAEVIRTDLSNVLKLQVEEIGQNIYERGTLLSTLRSLNKVNGMTKDTGNIIGAFQRSIVGRQLLNQNRNVLSEGDKALKNIISTTTKLAIGKITKVPIELGINTIRAAWTEGTAVFKNVDNVYKEMLDSVVPDKMSYSSVKQDIRKGTTLGGKLLDMSIVTADKAISPTVFKSAFDKSFEKGAGTKFDPKKYSEDFGYRLKYSEEIRKAGADGIVRLQELFNAKTALDVAPSVKIFTKELDKGSAVGAIATMLQSYNINEKNQMSKAVLNLSEGIRDKDWKLAQKGARDMTAIPITNFMYTQLTILTYSMMRQIWKDEDLSGVDDVLSEHYDKYLDDDSRVTSVASSMIGLVAGKYGNLMPILGGALLYTFKDDPNVSKEIKEAVLTSAKDAFIKPIDISSSSYGNLGRTIGGLHPTLKEAVNIWDMYVNFTALMGVGKEVDEDDKSWLQFGVDLSRYLFPNPFSNQFKSMIRDNKKPKKDNTKKSTTDDSKIVTTQTINVN